MLYFNSNLGATLTPPRESDVLRVTPSFCSFCVRREIINALKDLPQPVDFLVFFKIIGVGALLITKEDLLQAIAGVNDRIAKVTTDVASLRVSVFTFGPIILGLLVKLVFFP